MDIYLIDLRGILCPLNYVKIKVYIETMKIGETVEVLLDEGIPLLNVTQSLLNDGQTIVSCKYNNDHYIVTIKKEIEYGQAHR